MRRFEPAASRVRISRSSFTIAALTGRNARAVSGFNRRPVYAKNATAYFAPKRGQRPDRSGCVIQDDRWPPLAARFIDLRQGPGVLLPRIIKK